MESFKTIPTPKLKLLITYILLIKMELFKALEREGEGGKREREEFQVFIS
jgi:hypothetical protein